MRATLARKARGRLGCFRGFGTGAGAAVPGNPWVDARRAKAAWKSFVSLRRCARGDEVRDAAAVEVSEAVELDAMVEDVENIAACCVRQMGARSGGGVGWRTS